VSGLRPPLRAAVAGGFADVSFSAGFAAGDLSWTSLRYGGINTVGGEFFFR